MGILLVVILYSCHFSIGEDFDYHPDIQVINTYQFTYGAGRSPEFESVVSENVDEFELRNDHSPLDLLYLQNCI